jgi:type IV secretory pathway VirB10-like protein
MTRLNGHANDGHSKVRDTLLGDEPLNTMTVVPFTLGTSSEPATRAQQRAKKQIQQNRFVIIAAGAVVAALLIFAAVSLPHRGEPRKGMSHSAVATDRVNSENSDKSLFPIIDSARPTAKEDRQGFLNERDLQRTVTHRAAKTSQAPQTNDTGTLGSIAPFGDQAWQAPPYHPGSSVDISDSDKTERDAMQKSSLIYVRSASSTTSASHNLDNTVPDLQLGLATGTRLRARLESAISTAVRTPVTAAIEYNYQRDGEIVVPAGAKALGHIRGANRLGYVDVQFDSLLMPDGVSVPIEAAATDLDLRPLKGKVEGKNTEKNVLVRSLSGIGQAGAMLVGQSSLNRPLSESDLMRERVSSNIGEAGDEEVSRLAMNQQIVVTVSAGVPVYVVLEQAAKPNPTPSYSAGRSTPPPASANIEQLHQLLQLQQELNQPSSNASVQ